MISPNKCLKHLEKPTQNFYLVFTVTLDLKVFGENSYMA